MTAFTLKIIAILGMTANHFAHTFGDQLPNWLYYVLLTPGGLTFPIMACLMDQGYRYTRNFKRYAGRLLIFALISLIPFMSALDTSMLNVMFTLFLGLIIVYLDEHLTDRRLFGWLFLTSIALSSICDWNYIGVPMILFYHRLADNRKRQAILPLSFTWGITLLQTITCLFDPSAADTRDIIGQCLYSTIGCGMTIPLLLKYNGKQGPKLKYLFYAYYPAHLTILAILKHFILPV